MDTPHVFSFFSLPYRPINPHVSSRMIAGESLMLVEHRVKKGHKSERESHENEQLTLVLFGHLEFTINGKTHSLRTGEAILIPPFIEHSCEVFIDSVVIEVFSPPRKEWIKKT